MDNTYNGIMNVYKEKGFTSHDVVARLRGICKMKKIGHTGTLDPEAVGVLPVCFGSGTKLCDMLTDWDKEYRAVMRLGVVTDTQDMTGQILSQCGMDDMENLTAEQVQETVMAFCGDYDQIPPMYSALKVNGKKLYELARAGKEIERKPRKVQIKELEIEEIAIPLVRMRIVCSKGTYIRTLCHDIGAALGCGGVMESLIRSRVGIFGIENALTLAELESLRDAGNISSVIISPDAVFDKNQAVVVKEEARRMAENGNRLGMDQVTDVGGLSSEGAEDRTNLQLKDGEQVRVYDGRGKFYGIYAYCSMENVLKPAKMFLS